MGLNLYLLDYLILLHANSCSVCNPSTKSEVKIALGNGDLPQSFRLAKNRLAPRLPAPLAWGGQLSHIVALAPTFDVCRLSLHPNLHPSFSKPTSKSSLSLLIASPISLAPVISSCNPQHLLIWMSLVATSTIRAAASVGSPGC